MGAWTRALIALAIVVGGAGAARAADGWHLTDSCGGAHSSTHYFTSWDGCVAALPQYRSLAPSGCNVQCERYYGAGPSTPSSTAGYGMGRARYDLSNRRYPYGRTTTVGDLAAGIRLGVAGETETGMAYGPMSLTIRILRRVSIGGFFTVLSGAPKDGGDDYNAYAMAGGGHLRFSVMAGAAKNRRSYWELYVDLGYGHGWMPGGGWSGSGSMTTGALGLYYMTHWIVGIGLSTRFNYLVMKDAKADGGRVTDVDATAWNALMVSLLWGI